MWSMPHIFCLIQIISVRVRSLCYRKVRSYAILMQNMCHGNKMLPNVLLKIMQQECRMRRKILEIFRATGSLLEGGKKKLYSFLKRGFKILSSQGEETFKLRPCKITAAQQLLSIEWEAEKLQESVASGFLGPEFVFSRMRYGLH